MTSRIDYDEQLDSDSLGARYVSHDEAMEELGLADLATTEAGRNIAYAIHMLGKTIAVAARALCRDRRAP